MKQDIPNPYPGGRCFFCGARNAQGLKLTFQHDDERQETSTEYVPEERFAGQGDILHGGIQMGLLDEAMGWACYMHTREMAVTTTMKTEFLRPVRIAGTAVRIACRVTGQEGRKVHLAAELSNSEGIVCTRATGTYHLLTPEKYAAMTRGNQGFKIEQPTAKPANQ